jgi:hypothetical protein
MNKTNLGLVGLLAAGLFASCRAPVYVEQDNDVSLRDYKTYTWVVTSSIEGTESDRATQFADISVRNAVNAELRSQGWTEVASNADALVSYDILVERSVSRESDPVYSQPMTRYYYNPYRRRWMTLYYPSQFLGYDTYEVPVQEGTITISIIDTKTDKRIWQGWTTEEMNNTRFTENEIARGVRNIFNRFEESVAAR